MATRRLSSVVARPLAGLRLVPGYLDRAAQERLRDELAAVMLRAPAYTPRMPKTGRPMSVRMSNCGPLGWVTDERGYRYQPHHPETGEPWPPMPEIVLAAWRELADYPHPPEACLVNVYGPTARMGLHQDRDEQDFAAPVVSLSLGDTCLFRIGGEKRSDPTRTFRLASGDALVLGGQARLAHHGVDRIMPGTSSLLSSYALRGSDEGSTLRSPLGEAGPDGGRINLTLRRVSRPT
jgi:alkylated DNA repair protein (DNA oxidative demethylase)